MPVYEHHCPGCDTITEETCKIADRKQFVVCRECGGSAERIISGSQGIQRDEPTWLNSAVDNLADEAKVQIRDRSDFNRYLNDHGINHVG